MPGDIDGPHVGRYLCRIGSDKTVHQNLELRSTTGMRWGAREVHEVKSSVLNGRTYHYGDGYKMHPEEEQYLDSEPETRV